MLSKERIKESLSSIAERVFSKTTAKLMRSHPLEIIEDQNIMSRQLCGLVRVEDFVDDMMYTRLRTSRDTIMGNELEEFVWLFIKERFNGNKVEKKWGIDFEFIYNDILYLLQLKSGPNWANSDQKKKLKDNFNSRKFYHRKNGYKGRIKCILGIMANDPKKRNKSNSTYTCLAGQDFFTFLSGDETLFLELPNYLNEKVVDYSYCINVIRRRMIDYFGPWYSVNGMLDYSKLMRDLKAEEDEMVRR